MSITSAHPPTGEGRARGSEIASKNTLIHLDMVRGLAAMTVFIGHVRQVFFVPWEQLPHHSTPWMLFYFITALGHQAVVVFFVLSGFFIGWAVISAWRDGRWSWRSYAMRRLTRLGVVLLPALLLALLWDQIGVLLWGASTAYNGGRPYETVLHFNVRHNLTLSAFIGNLFFLQDIRVPWFGSDAPLWSLSYEFWYYLLFPLMAGAVFVKPKRWRSVFAIASVIVLIWVGRTIAAYYLVWLLGVAIVLAALWFRSRGWHVPRIMLVPTGLLFAAGIVVAERRLIAHGADAVLAVFCALFLAAVVLSPASRSSATRRWAAPAWAVYQTVARRLAGISYTLYLVHLPPLVFLRAAVDDTTPWLPDARHLAVAGLFGVAVLAFAFLVASVTEARTDSVRRWLERTVPALAARVIRRSGGREQPAARGVGFLSSVHAAFRFLRDDLAQPVRENLLAEAARVFHQSRGSEMASGQAHQSSRDLSRGRAVEKYARLTVEDGVQETTTP